MEEINSIPTVQPIGSQQVRELTNILQKYKAGKARTERRILASENWWKLRNSVEEQETTEIGKDGGFRSVSGWLHNVIVSKHADAMDAYPEPNVLPREEADKAEAKILSGILPCILEQNDFEQTYSDAMWQKLKTGTGAYKVVWDTSKLNGLGDITIERVNLLNLFWEPGVTDIQKSRYFFHTELMDKELLRQQYPEQLEGRLKTPTFLATKFLYDDAVDTTDKATVIDVYYHKIVGGRKTLQYVKYVEDVVLYATENEPEMAEQGLYHHGRFPYVFDTLFPVEGSPCGYGFVDLCKNPQTEIDLMKTAFVKNTMAGATPRYFSRGDGTVNEAEFLDLSAPLVHTTGAVNDDVLRRIESTPLNGTYVNMLDRTIQELRETSGNTETSTGSTTSGVTAASAIAALQEASGKGSRDSTQAAYRAYGEIIEMCIELIRQFYDVPRKFRIVGEHGMQHFISYTNEKLAPAHQGTAFGKDMGYRTPVFDIKISAQKRNAYTKMAQNELALQFFKLGFFNPQMAEQALLCLDMMEFDGKDELVQKISVNASVHRKMMDYMQLALALTQKYEPRMLQQLSADVMQSVGGGGAMPMSGAPISLPTQGSEEHAVVTKARERANAASQPHEGGSVKERNV